MRTRLLALLAALALVAGACGSDSDDAADDTGSTQQVESPATTDGSDTDGDGTTFGEVVPRFDAEPARFEGGMRLIGSTGSQMAEPIQVQVFGSLDPDQDAMHLSMDVAGLAKATLGGEGTGDLPPQFAGMFDEPLEVITIGGSTWIKFPLLAMAAGAETAWIEVAEEAAGQVTSSLGLGPQVSSPTALLDQLRDADATVTEVGTEEVRGTETTHYRTELDLTQLAESLNDEERQRLEQDLGGADRGLPIDVWVDDDGRLFRYRMDLATSTGDPEVEFPSIEFEFFDHGTPVTIEPPPSDQVTPASELGGFLGGAGDVSQGEGSAGG